MYYVYVLKSKKDGSIYIGYTHDLVRRLKEHNNGKNISTKYKSPFEVGYLVGNFQFSIFKQILNSKYKKLEIKN
jgi:putative endonuclease